MTFKKKKNEMLYLKLELIQKKKYGRIAKMSHLNDQFARV